LRPRSPRSVAPSVPAFAAANIKIGVAFPNSDTFLSRVQDGMKAEATAKGVAITITRCQGRHRAAHASQVEKLHLARRDQRSSWSPVDTSAAQPMVDAAKKANIPDHLRQPQPVHRGRAVRGL